ncbi:MAG: galactose mutarotase [Dysgonomonas mossii]|uniref:aldose epimerase family protein n=1 Tax=Dysgonomonas mossii TaxID=163665 RepID=UPI001D1E195E|nr:aldose epimerase family protein [Dysgonomonas mossii]MBS5797417.1 galactose mutarotase [Dysgonomonas mossii]MBS7110811.1 galactose mutarotase [Dysgonomonas mossii]
MKKTCLAVLTVLLLAVSCTEKVPVSKLTESGLDKKNFETEVNGKKVGLFVLKNTNGMEVCVTNYGGRIVSVLVPDKDGNKKDVVIGFDSIQDYINVPGNNYGAAIGRYGNRIGNGTFELDGVKYDLPKNNFGHTLHGGDKGFHTVVFDANQIDDKTIELTYLSKDGEEGFPGNLKTKITYTLKDDNAIDIKYEAETDKPTVVNLTNHTYFNMDGDPDSKNTDWLLMLNADKYTPVDSTFMTTGELLPVEGTDMDFRTPTAIGARIDNYDFVQLKNGKGYDHNWVLNTGGDINKVAATLESSKTGIVLETYTTEPGLQFYAGNFMDGKDKGKKGKANQYRAAVCLETQKYPDTPNKKDWPSATLRPGEKYTSETIYKFSVKK